MFDGGRHYFHSNVLFNSRYAGLRLYSVIIGTGFDFWDHAAPNKSPGLKGNRGEVGYDTLIRKSRGDYADASFGLNAQVRVK